MVPEFLADENIAAPLVQTLRDAGWDVLFIPEEEPGISDEDVLRRAYDKGRVLLTEDKDFGELIFRLQWDSAGVLLLRLPPAPWQEHWARLQVVLKEYAERLYNVFTVVEQRRVRFRPVRGKTKH